MRRMWRLGLTILFVSLVLAVSLATRAQNSVSAARLSSPKSQSNGDIQVTQNVHEYAFRNHITFRLEASSDADIIEIVLFARVSGESGLQRDEPGFESGRSVSAEVSSWCRGKILVEGKRCRRERIKNRPHHLCLHG